MRYEETDDRDATEQTVSGILVSVQVGRAHTLDAPVPWTTAIFKRPVTGQIRLHSTGLEEDEQANSEHHGGPDKAVCVYSDDHSAAWRRDSALESWGPGAVGENFTVSGQSESSVAIGDAFEVGDAIVQVSQPREPCWKLARRWGQADFIRRVLVTGRTGWYLRVLREGWIRSGDRLRLVARPHERWTISEVNRSTFQAQASSQELADLCNCELLASGWRERLRRRLSASDERK